MTVRSRQWGRRLTAAAMTLGTLVAFTVSAPAASALDQPLDGTWEFAVGSGTLDLVTESERLVTVRATPSVGPVLPGFSIEWVWPDGRKLSVDLVQSASGNAYESDWEFGLGDACGLLPVAYSGGSSTETEYRCEPADVRLVFSRVTDKKLSGKAYLRVSQDIMSTNSVNLVWAPPRPGSVSGLTTDAFVGNTATFSTTLRWRPVTGADRYRVTLRAEGGPTWNLNKDVKTAHVKLLDLWPSTVYQVTVTARNSRGSGPQETLRLTTPGTQNLPWVVSLGDSFISGEGGRWAGNASEVSQKAIDALGHDAYWDGEGGEKIRDCHRSKSAMIHIKVVNSLNLACSGATTSSVLSGGTWKPGIDFARPEAGRLGQALMLQEFARTHDVQMVVLSIGGNDLNFGAIIEECVKDYLIPARDDCSTEPDIRAYVGEAKRSEVRRRIEVAIGNIVTAMEEAGHPLGTWTLVSTLYPQPVATSDQMRYRDVVGTYWRQTMGGCGFHDEAVDWASVEVLQLVNDTVRRAQQGAVLANPGLKAVILDNSVAFHERTLCHKAVNRVAADLNSDEWRGPRSWEVSNAVDRSEWVVEIELLNPTDTMKQESVHPNYWGQRALRNCLRQVWNNGNVQGGVCSRGKGLNRLKEPNMSLSTSRSAEGRWR